MMACAEVLHKPLLNNQTSIHGCAYCSPNVQLHAVLRQLTSKNGHNTVIGNLKPCMPNANLLLDDGNPVHKASRSVDSTVLLMLFKQRAPVLQEQTSSISNFNMCTL